MYCMKCGTKNEDSKSRCAQCGEPLLVSTTPRAPDEGLEILIPYRNAPALVAYYIGVFSIIPCFGPLLGIAAVILGILGLRKAKAHPESRGKVHAWIGIVAGGFFGLLYLAAIVALIVFAALKR